MFLLPPRTNAHWVYDDPSGVPEPPASEPVAKPKSGKVVRFPLIRPATPKAA